MTQKRRKADSGKAIGETTALRWEPTHVTKPNPRVVPLQNQCEFVNSVKNRTDREWRRGVINKSILWNNVLHFFGE